MQGLWRFVASLVFLLPLTGQADEFIDADHVRIQWLAPDRVGSEPEVFGVLFEVDPEWHVYWLNPGDSGAAPRFNFSGNASVGEVLWPWPERLPIAHLTNIGYEGDIAYLFEVTPEPGAERLQLTLDLEWLVCKEDCIPGFGLLTLERPVAASSEWSVERLALRDTFIERLPKPADDSPGQITHTYQDTDGSLILHITGSADSKPQVYPKDGAFVSPATPDTRWQDDVWKLRFSTFAGMKAPETLGFVLVADEQAWAFNDIPLGTAPLPTLLADTSLTNLAILLLSAFIGGIILNLMPCVFPVLSIKLFSLINSQGGDDLNLKHRVREGLLYTAGVLATFAALGAIFLALRAGGAAVGWGFQLQSPVVVLALALLFWIMALSFMGVFEFGHGIMRLAGKGGSGSSFGTGVLAVFVAAPCTGPFMGAALGASATLPALPAMAIFLGLGAGLAAPFLLLAVSPALSSRLPRPGPWMETLRQFLAFPLFATVLWLLWVLGRLGGEGGWLLGGILLLLIAFCVWLARSAKIFWRWLALILALVAIVFGLQQAVTLEPDSTHNTAYGEWHAYDSTRIAEARAEGRAVFIDYTAAWCITCQVNKAVVLDTQAVDTLFSDHNVLRIRADWTRYDSAITESLARLGRNSVPVYAFYPAEGGEVQVLPQILSVGMLRELFEP